MVALRRARNSPAAPEKRSRDLQTRRGLSAFDATGGKQRPASARLPVPDGTELRLSAQRLSRLIHHKREARAAQRHGSLYPANPETLELTGRCLPPLAAKTLGPRRAWRFHNLFSGAAGVFRALRSATMGLCPLDPYHL